MHTTVGHSQADDARSAGRDAAEEAKTDDSRIAYVFASTRYDLDALVAAVDEVFGDVPVVGCSSTAEITPEGAFEGSVVVGALNGEDVDVGVGIGRDLGKDSYAAGRNAIHDAVQDLAADEVAPFRKRRDEDWRMRQETFVTLFSDPLHGTGVEVLEGVNQFLGPGFSTTGQFAGDDLSFEHTYVFHGGEAVEDAVVAAVVSPGRRVSSGHRHGFSPTEETGIAEETEGNVLKQVRGTTPRDEYATIYGEDKADDPGFLLMTPFGLSRKRAEEHELRVAIDVTDEGHYVCGANVPEGEELALMMGEKPKLLEAAGEAGVAAREAGGFARGEVDTGILFSCAGRYGIYDDIDTSSQEVRNVADALGDDATVFGCFAYGQIAPTGGWAAFNEETMAVQVVGKD